MWDISRVRGLDGQEVGHVCGTYPGRSRWSRWCGTYPGLEV